MNNRTAEQMADYARRCGSTARNRAKSAQLDADYHATRDKLVERMRRAMYSTEQLINSNRTGAN